MLLYSLPRWFRPYAVMALLIWVIGGLTLIWVPGTGVVRAETSVHQFTIYSGEAALVDLSANAWDELRVIQEPEFGQLESVDSGWRYQSFPGYFGADSFQYEACIADFCSPGQVNLVVELRQPLNAPEFYLETVNTRTLLIDLRDEVVRANPKVDQQQLTLEVLTTQTEIGAGVEYRPDGTLLYSPVGNYRGQDVFNYEICDGLGCDISTVFINVIQGNEPPRPQNDQCRLVGNTDRLCAILDNDQDIDDGLNRRNVSIFSPPEFGTANVVVGEVESLIRYRPSIGFVGTDVLEYQVCDFFGECRRAFLELIVTAPPVSQVTPEPVTPLPVEAPPATFEPDPVSQPIIEEGGDSSADLEGGGAEESVGRFQPETEEEVIPILTINQPQTSIVLESPDADAGSLTARLMTLMGGIGALLVPVYLHLTANPMGMMIGGHDLSLRQRIDLVKHLGGGYYKPDTIYLDNWWEGKDG